MIEFDYLQKGLYALARAHRVSNMSGHLGAAVVAGYFIGEQHPDLDKRVYKGIEAELDRIILGESVFSPGKDAVISASEMFEPFAKEQPKASLIGDIAEALAGNIDHTRQSGHNVIFATIAIRALKDHPELALPAVVDGIRKLIAGFDGASPGSGYYGKEKGRIDGNKITLQDDESFPSYANLNEMGKAVLDELIFRPGQRREGFGGMHHIINHAAALAELENYGYPELAREGLPAHHQHLMLFRSLPDVADEHGVETPTEFSPFAAEFWKPDKIRRERAHLTHRVKTMYGFQVLTGSIAEPDKIKIATDNLRYLM